MNRRRKGEQVNHCSTHTSEQVTTAANKSACNKAHLISWLQKKFKLQQQKADINQPLR